MRINRRSFLTGIAVVTAGCANQCQHAGSGTLGSNPEELDRVAAASVLKLDGLTSLVVARYFFPKINFLSAYDFEESEVSPATHDIPFF